MTITEQGVENPTQHFCLTILDIIKFLGETKLSQLEEDTRYAIIINYNRGLDDEFHLNSDMDGVAIRRLFDTLPNDQKDVLRKRIITFNVESREFIENLFEIKELNHSLYVKDIGSSGTMLNALSMLIITSVILLYLVYQSNNVYRGEIPSTVGDGVIKVVIDTLVEYFSK